MTYSDRSMVGSGERPDLGPLKKSKENKSHSDTFLWKITLYKSFIWLITLYKSYILLITLNKSYILLITLYKSYILLIILYKSYIPFIIKKAIFLFIPALNIEQSKVQVCCCSFGSVSLINNFFWFNWWYLVHVNVNHFREMFQDPLTRQCLRSTRHQ